MSGVRFLTCFTPLDAPCLRASPYRAEPTQMQLVRSCICSAPPTMKLTPGICLRTPSVLCIPAVVPTCGPRRSRHIPHFLELTACPASASVPTKSFYCACTFVCTSISTLICTFTYTVICNSACICASTSTSVPVCVPVSLHLYLHPYLRLNLHLYLPHHLQICRLRYVCELYLT